MPAYPGHEFPIYEYAKVIHEAWDKAGHKPPAGFSSWMDYCNKHYGGK